MTGQFDLKSLYQFDCNMIGALNRTTNPIGRTSAIPHHNGLPAYLIDCSCHHDITESINRLFSDQYTTVLILDARFCAILR